MPGAVVEPVVEPVVREREVRVGQIVPLTATPDLKPQLSEQQNMLHAFSYHGVDAGISQRTINESAAVAEYLNGHD